MTQENFDTDFWEVAKQVKMSLTMIRRIQRVIGIDPRNSKQFNAFALEAFSEKLDRESAKLQEATA